MGCSSPRHERMVKRRNASHLKKEKKKNLSQLLLAAGIYLIRTGDYRHPCERGVFLALKVVLSPVQQTRLGAEPR